MRKKNWDVVIFVIWAIVLVIWIIVYFFIAPSFTNKNSLVVEESVSKTEMNNGNDNISDYQFLLDTKDIYCSIIELKNYVKELGNKTRENKNATVSDIRINWKKWLTESEILWIDRALIKYNELYSNSSFIKSVNLINLMYEYVINWLQTMSRIEKLWDANYEDSGVSNTAFHEARENFINTLREEYMSIHWEDVASWQKEESELLDLDILCPVL